MADFEAALNLTKRMVRQNFNVAMKEFDGGSTPTDTILDSSNRAAPTHTFGAIKTWGTGRSVVYVQILFRDRALISMRQRERVADEQERKAAVAKKFGLDQFVFAYLGVHDPYYAHATFAGGITYPFGIYFKRTLESFPRCNATRRDLHSPDSRGRRDFFLAADARVYIAYEMCNLEQYASDFWRYWGTMEDLRDPMYRERQWEWRAEFHYKDRVSVEDFDAVLWPFPKARRSKGGVGASLYERRAGEFARNNAHCAVIPYRCDATDTDERFQRASASVTAFYLQHGNYPDDADTL